MFNCLRYCFTFHRILICCNLSNSDQINNSSYLFSFLVFFFLMFIYRAVSECIMICFIDICKERTNYWINQSFFVGIRTCVVEFYIKYTFLNACYYQFDQELATPRKMSVLMHVCKWCYPEISCYKIRPIYYYVHI